MIFIILNLYLEFSSTDFLNMSTPKPIKIGINIQILIIIQNINYNNNVIIVFKIKYIVPTIL